MPMGYQGYAKLTPSVGETPILLLTSGASVNMTIQPIMSSAVWGAGWYNAAQTTHYADGGLTYEGSIEIDLQATQTTWNALRDWAIEYRAYSKTLEICPDGVKTYTFTSNQDQTDSTTYDNSGAWCTSLSFSTSEGSFVTSSVGVIALDRTLGNTGQEDYISNRTGVTSAAEMTALNPLNPDGSNTSPIPFWQTNAELLYDAAGTYPMTNPPQTNLETVDWSVDVGNNHVLLYTCSGSREATALLMGPITASGNVTLYHPETVFDPIFGDTEFGVADIGTEESPFLTAETTMFKVTIGRGTATDTTIILPAVMVNSDDYGLKDAGSITNRAFGLEGLGGRVSSGNILPPCVMSSAVD